MWQLEPAIGLDTDFEASPAPRRGPRTALSDAQLHNRRDQLAQAFEAAWAEIGWELQTSKGPEELVKIFAPLLSTYAGDNISVFCRPSTEPTDSATLRKVRAKQRSLVGPSYSAVEVKRRVHEQLQRVNWALGEKSKTQRRIVKQEQKKLRKEASSVEQESRSLSDTCRNVEMQLAALEASFARQELFRFLKSGRYELTPLSLANAVANLPYSGWRQSMRRCKKQPSKFGNGLTYQIFKAIRYLAAAANKRTVRDFIKDFQMGIPLLPRRHKLAQIRLADHWLYIERAVRRAYQTNPIISAMPFKITGQYLKQLQSQTHVDVVLLEHAKIKLSKRPTASGT